MSRTNRRSRPTRIFQKFFVSAFVIVTFIAYALHERSLPADQAQASQVVIPTRVTQQTQNFQDPATVTPVPTEPPPAQSNDDNPTVVIPTAPRPTTTHRNQPTRTNLPPTDVPPTDVPQPTQQVLGQYRDGTYTGPQVDAFYGLVQVRAVIQSGKLANVQFLDYPHDRRTSQQINNIAMPYLQDEAMQAQNAQVDIISGATLTSEAFIESLASALQSAKNGS